jgi:hypothetical protein
MSTRQIPRGRRLVLCLGLLGFLGWMSGCTESNPVDAVGPEVGKQKGEAQQKAREQAYGKGGAPKSEKTAKKQ